MKPNIKIPDFNEVPFIVIWELTRACELHCLHCRAEAQTTRNPFELSTEEGKALIDDISDMEYPMLVFTGGDPLMRTDVFVLVEYAVGNGVRDYMRQSAASDDLMFVFTVVDPFMRTDVFELAEYAVGKGVRVSMTPSATPNVTKEAMQKAKDAGLSRWAFSIDGHNKQIHDHFRGTEGSFDLTMQAIKYLNELEMPLQINTVISNYNIEYLEEMRAMVEELNCVLWSVFFLVPTGRGKNEDMITPAQHEQVFRWLNKIKDEVPFDIK